MNNVIHIVFNAPSNSIKQNAKQKIYKNHNLYFETTLKNKCVYVEELNTENNQKWNVLR